MTTLRTFVSPLLASVVFLAMDTAVAKSKGQKDDPIQKELRLKAGDESGNEIKALKTEMLVIKSEKNALKQLQKLVRKHEGTALEPELVFRLAELYMRRARSERFFEVHKQSDQVVNFVPELVRDASEMREIRQAIAIYESMMKRFPEFRGIDVVIFNTAYARQQLGEEKPAEEMYRKLVTEHAGSELVPDGYLALGEIHYGRRLFPDALAFFKKTHKFPNARVYPYGLYKAAWCFYNMQDAASAMAQLEQVVKFGREIALSKRDSKLDLRKESLNDLTLFYGDAKPSSGAVDYLRQQAQELDASPFILRLAELYKRHSRFGDIDVVLRDFLKKMPESPSVPTAHEELVWNHERLKQRSAAVAQLEEFARFCAATAPKPKDKKDKPARTECQDKIADASQKLGSKWHGLWKKGADEELSASAEKAYRLYMRSASPADELFSQTKYQFAELLFQRGQFREASDQYAEIQAFKPEKMLAHDAAYGAVVSLEKAVSGKWSDGDEKRFVELSDVYVTNHATGQYVLELQFKRAFIAYEKERYDEAALAFKKIGWNTSATDKTNEKLLKAQDLYLDILNIKKDFRGLREAASLLLRREGLEAGRTTQIEKIYREAYFAEIQVIEEKGDLKGAVSLYKKFALENKASELAMKAWWNASQIQFRMGDVQGGAGTCYHMHKLFPRSDNGRDCLMKSAQSFESLGRLDLAARVLLNLALVDTGNEAKWRELSADFFALSGGRDRAKAMYEKLGAGAKGAVALALLEKTWQLENADGNTKGLKAVEAKMIALGVEPRASALIVEQAEADFAKGDHTKAFNSAKRIVGRESLPKNLQARARFIQARVLEDEFLKQSVKARAERIGLVLGLKTEKLEKAQKGYQAAIKYGDPEIMVQSLRRLADCYRHYSIVVRDMRLPTDTPEADRQAFQAELENLAIPMEEKGIDSLSQALEAAKKFELRDGSIAELQSEINKRNMKATTVPSKTVDLPSIVLPAFVANEKPGVGT